MGLEGETLAECLEDYFMRSEQLPTRLFIRTSDKGAAGILLQVMPAQDTEKEVFDHLATLTETIKTEELIDLPANEALWRLYHQEEVTLYDPQPVIYKCTCSRERCGEVLNTLPQEEVDEIIAEDGKSTCTATIVAQTMCLTPSISPVFAATPLRIITSFTDLSGGFCRPFPAAHAYPHNFSDKLSFFTFITSFKRSKHSLNAP